MSCGDTRWIMHNWRRWGLLGVNYQHWLRETGFHWLLPRRDILQTLLVEMMERWRKEQRCSNTNKLKDCSFQLLVEIELLLPWILWNVTERVIERQMGKDWNRRRELEKERHSRTHRLALCLLSIPPLHRSGNGGEYLPIRRLGMWFIAKGQQEGWRVEG